MSVFEFIFVSFVVIVVLAVTVFAVVTLDVSSTCLRAGWASSNVDWQLNGYCTKEVNETELTVPVSEVANP